MSEYGEIWKILKKHTSEEIWQNIQEELVEALVRYMKKGL